MQHLRSFREFLDALRAIGELQDIACEVDWNLEMGAITRRSMDLRARAPLFNRIAGIAPGFRAFGAPGGLSALPGLRYGRINLALGLPADSDPLDAVRSLAEARKRPLIRPRVVASSQAP